MIGLAVNKDQIEDEISRLRAEVRALSVRSDVAPERPAEETLTSTLSKLMEERERTNRALQAITEKINRMEQQWREAFEAQDGYIAAAQQGQVEVPVSHLDGMILDFVKTKGMACADDVKEYMGYRGRNAACNRLNRLVLSGFLVKTQLGHKVYYRIDAGKATNALIISPPQ